MTIALQAKRDFEFLYEVIVDCPKCGDAATIRLREPSTEYRDLMHGPRRVVCTHCGLSRDQGFAPVALPTMGLSLRLRAETRHGELVFYNRDHLAYVATFLRSRDRRVTVTEGGVRNGSITSRLPRWAKLAANRDDVLRALERLSRT